MNESIPPLKRQGLHLYGIEEVEWNVCADNAENRRILSNHSITYKVLDVGLLEVDFMSDDDVTEKQRKSYNQRKWILKDPKDAWGDYIPFDTLPVDYIENAPAWIQRKLNDWEEYQEKLAAGEKVKKPVYLPIRCERRRADGSRCWNWSWPIEARRNMCRGHMKHDDFDVTAQSEKIKTIAKMRFNQMTPAALDAIEDLIVNSPVPQVRLQAAKTLLEHAGFKPGVEVVISGKVEHQVVDPAQAVRERLAMIAERNTVAAEEIAKLNPDEDEESSGTGLETVEADDIVEAELVEEPAEESVRDTNDGPIF